MRVTALSRMFFAATIIAVGALNLILIYGYTSLVRQAMPHWVLWQGVWTAWIYGSGVVMLASGAGLFLTSTAAVAIRVLLVYLLLSLLFLKVPILVKATWVIGSWENFAEGATLVSGAWVIFASLTGQGHSPWLRFAVGDSGIRMARALFAIALFLFGLSHFGYLKYTASLVPAWLPWHLGWTCLTGAAYMAACLGILFRICPRLAAALTAIMMGLFQLLIWIPKVIAMPNLGNWSELLVGCAFAASAWVVTDSYRDVPWRFIGKLSRAVVASESRSVT